MKRPGIIATLVVLAGVDCALRVFGFVRVMRGARRLTSRPEASSDAALIKETFQQILTATAFYPGRSQCLEQSVAGYVLLRRRGFDVHVRIGVQPYPFAAHAWLELDGRPLTESEEVVQTFAIMPEVAV
ncbi:MAG TPA: lasso peptide biosynthesis B2 protein [Longimicrobiales bacterium]